MTARGRVTNGTIVLENGCPFPENTQVVIWATETTGDMAEEGRKELLRGVEEIQALPLEGSRDGFSGADHDRVLYGGTA